MKEKIKIDLLQLRELSEADFNFAFFYYYFAFCPPAEHEKKSFILTTNAGARSEQSEVRSCLNLRNEQKKIMSN